MARQGKDGVVRKKVVFFALGIAGAGFVGWWVSGSAGNGSPIGLPESAARPVGDSVVISGDGSFAHSPDKPMTVPALPRDERVRDIEVDGSIRLDMNGNLILDPALRRYLDFYIGLTGDARHAEALKRRLIAEMRLRNLPAQVQQEVLEILDNYLAYLGAAEALAARQEGDVQDLQVTLDKLHDLRRRHLGPDVADGFFGDEEARLRLMLDRQRILADDSINAKERERALLQIDQLLPDYAVETRRRSETVVSTSLKVMEMRRQGVPEEEVRALRLEAYGPEATERLSRLDEQRSRWQKRVAEYQRQRERIDQSSGLAADDRQAELEALQSRMFENEHELRRIRAIERASDEGA